MFDASGSVDEKDLLSDLRHLLFQVSDAVFSEIDLGWIVIFEIAFRGFIPPCDICIYCRTKGLMDANLRNGIVWILSMEKGYLLHPVQKRTG